MLDWQSRDYIMRTDQLHWPSHYAHRLDTMQWEYASGLCRLCNVHNPIAEHVKPLYEHCTRIRATDVMNYRNTRFSIVSNTFTELEDE
jgi:hypothetical protein